MNETLKRISYQTKTADVDEKGIVTVAVNGIGIEDSQKDISMPGSFVDTIRDDIGRMRHFLNHDTTQLLGVPLYGEEKADNLIVESQLNLNKQIGRDILTDYKLYAEAGRTLEHSVGVKALVRDKEDKRKVLKWRMYEFSTLTSWGANPNTYLVGIKSASSVEQIRDAVDILTLACKQKGYSDERFMNMERELKMLLKSLEGGNIVVCPHCGFEFDYDQAEKKTFQQIVLESAARYTNWLVDDIVYEQINALEPAIRADVLAIIDAAKTQNVELNEKGVTDLAEYAYCPHCYGRVYKTSTLLQSQPENKVDDKPIEKQEDATEKADAPQVETPEEDFFENLNKIF